MAALDEFAKIPASRKVAGVLVLLLITGVAYYFARYQSLSNEHDRLRARQGALQTQEREFLQKRDTYETDVRRLAQLREHFATQSRILPPDAEMSSFLDHLNNHAELAGLEIARVEPRDEEGVGFYAKIPVELHLKGRYHDLSKFFYNIGQLERVINVENIQLDVVASGSREAEDTEIGVVLQAKVLATTFRALESEAGSGEASAGQGGG